jgi:hypothetical protein
MKKVCDYHGCDQIIVYSDRDPNPPKYCPKHRRKMEFDSEQPNIAPKKTFRQFGDTKYTTHIKSDEDKKEESDDGKQESGNSKKSSYTSKRKGTRKKSVQDNK